MARLLLGPTSQQPECDDCGGNTNDDGRNERPEATRFVAFESLLNRFGHVV
jgi:hypothetical protein